MADTLPPATVKSAMRTLDIIEYVVSRGRPLVAQEISGALGIPVSSLSYLLGTLVERGYLARAGRRYATGPGLERLQTHAPAFTLAETVAPLVRTLRIQLNETVSFFVRRGWEVEALVTETSEQALRYAVQTGSHTPLHGFSAGKALLAAMDDAELDLYFAETERVAFTPTTIIAEPAIRAEIAEIRRTGIARTREEHTPGIHGMGRVARIDGEVVGAFSVAIPAVRFNEEIEQRAAHLLERAGDLLGSD
ncbi:IclR family transcriptional regulator [Sphingomonas sp. So64.6b]|uniref:IclR family transcriptional regulator n=1 Tax=Sphingomonas sp. So64.6b TaxID=2997354 RepID=UPI001FCF236C|nr:IclR family transcriptional regulator [Sphingomonas sp. So64.6b]